MRYLIMGVMVAFVAFINGAFAAENNKFITLDDQSMNDQLIQYRLDNCSHYQAVLDIVDAYHPIRESDFPDSELDAGSLLLQAAFKIIFSVQRIGEHCLLLTDGPEDDDSLFVLLTPDGDLAFGAEIDSQDWRRSRPYTSWARLPGLGWHQEYLRIGHFWDGIQEDPFQMLSYRINATSVN